MGRRSRIRKHKAEEPLPVFERGDRVALRPKAEVVGYDDYDQHRFRFIEGDTGLVIDVGVLPTVWFDGSPDSQVTSVHPSKLEKL